MNLMDLDRLLVSQRNEELARQMRVDRLEQRLRAKPEDLSGRGNASIGRRGAMLLLGVLSQVGLVAGGRAGQGGGLW